MKRYDIDHPRNRPIDVYSYGVWRGLLIGGAMCLLIGISIGLAL